jgi:hypothetical protein
MRKQGSSNCCLWFTLLGLAVTCVCVVAGGVFLLLANEVNRIAMATPTPITTCEGLLENIHKTSGANKNILVDKRYILDVYQVDGDQISEPQNKSIPEYLLSLQNDIESQKLIWDYFVFIIPPEQRIPLTEYRIFSDGSGNKTGYTEIQWSWTKNSESENWALEVDLADYQDLKSVNDVLVHEFGHMLTLNIHQADIRTEPVACQFYADGNQCSSENSYLNRFFDQFWKGSLYDEWKAVISQSDEKAVKSGLTTFYQAYPQDFVREYAATAPKEDLAESWTYFVMTPRPAGDIMAEQKILFFYNIPEFVDLRSRIRSRICKYYNMPE